MFMCLGVCISHAQSRRIEALKESLDEAPPDSHKVDRLNELSWELHRVDLDASLEYARKARTLAEKFSYPKGISRALNLEGIFYILRNQPAEAIQLNRHALSIARKVCTIASRLFFLGEKAEFDSWTDFKTESRL